MSSILVLGLTGGIATGKSTFLTIIKKLFPSIEVFDSDRCVHQLYQEPKVIAKLVKLFGEDVVDGQGLINKPWLREVIFSNPDKKSELENLIHPLVRKECLAMLEETSKNMHSTLFIADVPLLFENDFNFGQSQNILIASSKKKQIERIAQRNQWCPKTIKSVIDSQLPIEDKIKKADIVMWNEGSLYALQQQSVRFLNTLNFSDINY